MNKLMNPEPKKKKKQVLPRCERGYSFKLLCFYTKLNINKIEIKKQKV